MKTKPKNLSATSSSAPPRANLSGWQTVKLGAVAEHSLGKMLDKAKNKGTPQRYLRNLNVRWFEFDLSDVLEMRFLPEEAERYTVRKGDLVICEGGYPGRAAIWQDDAPIFFQKALHRVRFHEPERAQWCLYYLQLRDLEGTLRRHFNGAGIQHFTGEALHEFEIPLPPLPEQRRIVGILDEALAGIAAAKAHAERNRQNARALFESHLHAVFSHPGPGWVEKPLSSLCEDGRVITYGVVQLGQEIPGGVPCLRTSNVRWLRIDIEGMKRIAPELSASYSRTVLQGGEVLVNVRGTLGGVGVATDEMRGWNVSREVAVAPVARAKIDPAFVALSIGSGVSQEWLGGVKKGAAYVGINIEDLRNLPVRYPKAGEQQRIVRQLDALAAETRRLEGLYERKAAALDELKQSLLHQAFSGQL